MATMMNYAIVEATAEATARNDARDERAAMGACPGGIDYDEMDEMNLLEKAKENISRVVDRVEAYIFN